MAETVRARSKGLPLFSPERKRMPLPFTPKGKEAGALGKLGILSVQDVLQHYPRYHVDRTQLRTIREIGEAGPELDGREVQIHARVKSMNRPIAIGRPTSKGRRKTLIKGVIEDETGQIEVSWFNQDWVARALQPGTEAFFYGRLGRFRNKVQMTAPRFETVKTGKEPFNVGRIIPIYPASAGLTSDKHRKYMWDTLEKVGPILDPV